MLGNGGRGSHGPLSENSTAQSSVAFLQQLRAKYNGPLIVIWDNGPAHRGPALREYLTTPGLNLRLVALPAYSPDFNPDEALWDWARQEVTANTCGGSAAKVREHIDRFFAGLAEPCRRRCGNAAAENCKHIADQLLLAATQAAVEMNHIDYTLRSV